MAETLKPSRLLSVRPFGVREEATFQAVEIQPLSAILGVCLTHSAIPGATHIPMGDIPSRLQELDPEQPTVVLCHHGARSLNVTMWLRQQGLEHVQSLAGGIDQWSRSIDPTIARY